MNEIAIFQNPEFGEVRTITEDGQTLFCGSDVAKALGYTNPTKAINDHCKGITERRANDSLGRQQNMKFIPEGDIYRLAAKSELPGADRFERWIFDEVLPSIRRTGSYSVKKPMTDYQQKMIETRERNSRIRSAQILERMAARYHGTTYEQVLHAHATKALTGEYLLPLPQTEKTYSATEVGELLGVTACRIGLLANQNGLKTEEFGGWYHDKSAHSAKEVEAFRYNEKALEKFRELLGVES